MSSIQPNDMAAAYVARAKAFETWQAGTQNGSFLDMVVQGRKDMPADVMGGVTGMGGITGMGSITGMGGLPASRMAELSAQAAGQVWPEDAEVAEAPSLEAMLKAKYPNIHYHVFDAGSSYWKTRNDYPHYLLYQDGDRAKETLENWRPEGDNPFYGSIDGRFIAPKEIHALGSVPPGSKAVVIHPKAQERMEQDPAYAREIYEKIDAWFAFDVARNEAIMPGSTWDMSQAVAIGEDGNICNACASTANGEITCSKSGSDDEENWWERRMARHAELMELTEEKQLEQYILYSRLEAAAAAKSRLAAMLEDKRLREIFGSEVAGIPTETMLAITQAQVWGNVAMMG